MNERKRDNDINVDFSLEEMKNHLKAAMSDRCNISWIKLNKIKRVDLNGLNNKISMGHGQKIKKFGANLVSVNTLTDE